MIRYVIFRTAKPEAVPTIAEMYDTEAAAVAVTTERNAKEQRNKTHVVWEWEARNCKPQRNMRRRNKR